MANLKLNIEIKDINVQKAAEAFLRFLPMEKQPNGEDKYPSTKAWVEEWLKRKLLRAINLGVDQIAGDAAQKLTEDIFT